MVVHAGKKETGTPLADTPTRPATRHGGMRDLHESSFSLSGKSGAAVRGLALRPRPPRGSPAALHLVASSTSQALGPPGCPHYPRHLPSCSHCHPKVSWHPFRRAVLSSSSPGYPHPPSRAFPLPSQSIPITPTSPPQGAALPLVGRGPWQSRELPPSSDLQPPSPRPSLRAPSVVWLRWLRFWGGLGVCASQGGSGGVCANTGVCAGKDGAACCSRAAPSPRCADAPCRPAPARYSGGTGAALSPGGRTWGPGEPERQCWRKARAARGAGQCSPTCGTAGVGLGGHGAPTVPAVLELPGGRRAPAVAAVPAVLGCQGVTGLCPAARTLTPADRPCVRQVLRSMTTFQNEPRPGFSLPPGAGRAASGRAGDLSPN